MEGRPRKPRQIPGCGPLDTNFLLGSFQPGESAWSRVRNRQGSDLAPGGWWGGVAVRWAEALQGGETPAQQNLFPKLFWTVQWMLHSFIALHAHFNSMPNSRPENGPPNPTGSLPAREGGVFQGIS